MKNYFKEFSKCVFSDEPRNAYMFFNCDEWKSYSSMNPQYNSKIFRDRRKGRRALWNIIKEQLENHAIEIEENKITTVRNLILDGDPSEASQYITYGNIMVMEEY